MSQRTIKQHLFASRVRQQHAMMLERYFVNVIFRLASMIAFCFIYVLQPSGEGAGLEFAMFPLVPAWTLACQEILSPFFYFSTCKMGRRMIHISFAHITGSASELGRLLCFNHAHYVDNYILIILTLLIEIELFHNYASVTER